jgi:hypothetical protein
MNHQEKQGNKTMAWNIKEIDATENHNMNNSDFFIAIYTNECKSYCDEIFFNHLLCNTDVSGAMIRMVDNSIGRDYFEKLREIRSRNINSGNNFNILIHHIDVSRDNPETLFLRNVTESVNLLRKMFLESDCKYFVILESDVLPTTNWLNLLEKHTDKYDIIGGIYYHGFHSAELFDHPDLIQPSSHILSGCTLYKREVIEEFPFRWNSKNRNAFPDAWICHDAGHKYKFANYSAVKCLHLTKLNGSRGLEDLK